MINLICDLMDPAITKHAQIAMRELGITYRIAVPQSLYDSWWFFDCKNVPSELPSYLRQMPKIDFHKLVGDGLSPEQADILTRAAETQTDERN